MIGDPVSSFDGLLTALGYGKFVPLVLSGVGFFSVVSTLYPPSWKGAGFVHKAALLVGNASPETPAVPAADKSHT